MHILKNENGGEKMKRKIFFAMIAIFSIMSALFVLVLPVRAYTYHGATTSWDRGGKSAPYPNTASYDTSTGEMGACATNGAAWAYMNSANVNAVADVSTINVITWYTDHDCYNWGGTIKFEVKLYVNGVYKGVKSITTYLSDNGYEVFTFTGLNVHNGDSLDIDAVFTVAALSPYVAWYTADFSYIAFYTP
jgi:hypothetical protein